MIIKDIKYIDNDATRVDGRYTKRIGSDVDFFAPPKIGEPMFLIYNKDNAGEPKDGVLRTSAVRDMYQTETELIITTQNSIYHFSKGDTNHKEVCDVFCNSF